MQKNQKQIKISRRLRSKQTDAEKLLWSKVRNRQLYGKFRRQHSLGPYIVDFVNLESKLIIEIDGGHHDGKEVKKRYQKNNMAEIQWLYCSQILEQRCFE